MNESFKEFVKDGFKSRVWDALEEIAIEYADVPEELHKEAMEQAVEWFMIQFYDKEA